MWRRRQEGAGAVVEGPRGDGGALRPWPCVAGSGGMDWVCVVPVKVFWWLRRVQA